MNKMHILIIALLISLSIFAFENIQVKAQITGISVSASSINRGLETSTLTAVVSGGPYNYQWMMAAPGQTAFTNIAGATEITYTFAPSSSATPGNYQFEVSIPGLFQSDPVSVAVTIPFTISVAPASWIMDVGQVQVFTAVTSGGSGALSYQWYLAGSAVSGQTGLTYAFTASSAGTPMIYCKVTDHATPPVTVQSNTPSITVAASPTVSVAPIGPLKMDVGQVQVFTAASLGGSGTIHYQWYVGSGSVGTDSSSYTYTASGSSASITCKVTDSASSPATSVASNAVSITVNPALVAPTVSASLGSISQGQTSSLTSSSVSTGSSPYLYQWLSKAPGAGSYSPISGATSSSYIFVTSGSTVIGSWSFELQVTDATSAGVISNAVSVTVNAVPTVNVSPASWTMDVGQSKTFSAAASGGSGVYSSYQWYAGGSLQSGATSSTFNYAPGSSGSYSITVTVTDSLGATSAQSSAASVTVAASPSVSIIPVGPLKMDIGQTKIFTAASLGGSGTIHYQWYVGSGSVGTDSSSYTYTASGSSASITCKVTDSASSPATSVASNAVSITVNPALVAPTVSASLGSISQGQTSSLTSSSVSTGSSPYLYQWLSKAPGAGSYSPISGATSSSYIFVTSGSTVIGSWSFELQVTDATGAVVNSFVQVTVTLSPTPTSSPIPTPTSTATPTPTSSSIPTPTSTATPTQMPSTTPEPIPTSTPTPTSAPTSASTPTSTPKPSSSPTSTAKPSTSPTPIETTVKAKTDSGATVNLAISGNITSSQMSNVTIITDISANSTTVSINVTGQSGNTGFSNITIPKTTINYGTNPVVFIDGQQATNQGYTQDSKNFYVWYTMPFSTHLIKIQFAVSLKPQTSSFESLLAVGIIAPEIVLVYTVIAIRRLRRRPENT